MASVMQAARLRDWDGLRARLSVHAEEAAVLDKHYRPPLWWAVVDREPRPGEAVITIRRELFLGDAAGLCVRTTAAAVSVRRADGALYDFSRGDVSVVTPSQAETENANAAVEQLILAGGPLRAVTVPFKRLAAFGAERCLLQLVEQLQTVAASALRVQGMNAPVHRALKNQHPETLIRALLAKYPLAAKELDGNRRTLLQCALRADAPAELIVLLLTECKDLVGNEDNEARAHRDSSRALNSGPSAARLSCEGF